MVDRSWCGDGSWRGDGRGEFRPRRPRVPWYGSVCGVLLVAAVSTSAGAQVVTGVVRDSGDSAVIADVDLTLTSELGNRVVRAISDANGRFVLSIPEPGVYRLGAGRIGYQTFTSDPFLVTSDQGVSADVFLEVSPVELPPLDVVTEGQVPALVRVGFYQRMQRGFGHFLQAEEIQALHATRLRDVFRRIPGFEVVSAGTGKFDLIVRAGRNQFFRIDGRGAQTCYPSVSMDGVLVRAGGPQPNEGAGAEPRDVGTWGELLHPNDLEAVEVYSGWGGLPAQVAGSVSPCGAVLIWTKG